MDAEIRASTAYVDTNDDVRRLPIQERELGESDTRRVKDGQRRNVSRRECSEHKPERRRTSGPSEVKANSTGGQGSLPAPHGAGHSGGQLHGAPWRSGFSPWGDSSAGSEEWWEQCEQQFSATGCALSASAPWPHDAIQGRLALGAATITAATSKTKRIETCDIIHTVSRNLNTTPLIVAYAQHTATASAEC